MIYMTYMIYNTILNIYSIKLMDRYLQLCFIPISPKSYPFIGLPMDAYQGFTAMDPFLIFRGLGTRPVKKITMGRYNLLTYRAVRLRTPMYS